MQGGRAHLGQLVLQPRPHGRVGAGEAQVVQDGLDVEAGPADQDGGAAGRQQVLDHGPGVPLVGGDRGGLGHVEHVEQVVRHALPLGLGHLGGADVHPPVQLHGVGVDHLAAAAQGQPHRQVGLSGGGGADDRDRPGRAGGHGGSA